MKEDDMGGKCGTHVWYQDCMHRKLWSENLKGRDHLEDWRIIL